LINKCREIFEIPIPSDLKKEIETYRHIYKLGTEEIKCDDYDEKGNCVKIIEQKED